MTDQPDTIFTLYPVFRASPELRLELADADDLRDAVQEVENLFEIIAQLGQAPDLHVMPVGNAGNISAYWMGFGESGE